MRTANTCVDYARAFERAGHDWERTCFNSLIDKADVTIYMDKRPRERENERIYQGQANAHLSNERAQARASFTGKTARTAVSLAKVDTCDTDILALEGSFE